MENILGKIEKHRKHKGEREGYIEHTEKTQTQRFRKGRG